MSAVCSSINVSARLTTPSSRASALPGRAFTSRLPARRTVHVRAEGVEDGKTPDTIDGKKVVKVSDPMSPEFKKRLREEYIGLGGSADKPMSQNYFLIIILVIGGLALLSYVTGSI